MLHSISQLGQNERKCFFQKDEAHDHTKSTTIDFLGPFFGKRLIGLNSVSGIEWPPRNPDLSPLDFFLWAYLLKIVYKTAVQNIPDLKTQIEEEIKKVSKQTLKNVFSNLLKLARACIAEEGNHF